MTNFEAAKSAVTPRMAAEHYGLNVHRNGMVCCPFHDDRHPSMKLNEDYFYCFGCGVKGDVIMLVARLYNLSNYKAAQKLVADFGLGIDLRQTAMPTFKPKCPHLRQFREEEMLCLRVLTDYLHLLEDWKVHYAPRTPEDELNDMFIEACQMLDCIKYLADILTAGDPEERVTVVSRLIEDGKIAFLQDYVARK